jgi:class 3 adenylate cyclase
MLPTDVQRKLAQRYGGATLVKEAFDQNIAKAFAVEFETERQQHAAVVMVDIAGFSSFVTGWSPAKIRSFLDDYYRQVMPTLYDLGGMIDRVAGDGVLAVFSSFFTTKTDEAMDRCALQAAEKIVASLATTNHSSKAALSSGPLAFCKTGLAGVYEEHTVIGEAITSTYRIEEIAKVNQVVVHGTRGFSAIIDEQLAARRRVELRNIPLPPQTWNVEPGTVDLRGVGETAIYVQQLNKPRP